MRITKILWIAIPVVFAVAIILTFLGPKPPAEPEVKLRQIVTVADAADPEDIERAREKIKDLYDQLEAGTDFVQLALEQSEALNAVDGGDMGWMGEGILPPTLEDVAFGLDKGHYSVVIQESMGDKQMVFRILYVEDRRNF
jgi:parvulin-like peptidyl-prolyl isomerase